jgi:hypothetical protein
MSLRLVGDVHQKMQQYINIVKDCEYSFQIGDMGFNYNQLYNLDSNRHKFGKGNHDLYIDGEVGDAANPPHCIGDYGLFNLGGLEFFFIRGERSIDWRYRTLGIDFFEEEELSDREMYKCLDLYAKTKPNLVISHGCPARLIPEFSRITSFDGEILTPSKTAWFLDHLYEIHQPSHWAFGHYHNDKFIYFNNNNKSTKFRCLGELSYVDLETE